MPQNCLPGVRLYEISWIVERDVYKRQVDGQYYWLGADGAMRTGWQEVWGKWYYLGKAADDGVMRTYWQEIDGEYYWLGADGAMRTGWQEVWSKWYYLDVAGVMQTGWIWTEGDKWYYTCLLYTSILDESSEIICYGEGSGKLVRDAFEVQESDSGYILPGVVSRKKQLIPAFIGTLQQNGN